jgi:Secretion system C-terminal sorting domain
MKNLKIIILCFFTAFGFSQLTLRKLDGSTINNNEVLTFTANTDPAAYLGIKIFNSSPNNINVKAECISIVNADGNDVQLCFGNVCVSGISEGTKYPNIPAVIPANGQNGNFDHFLNLSSGTMIGSNVEYTFRFFMLDTSNQEIGNSVTFTYRYAPLLSTNAFTTLSDLGIKLKSNIVSNQLDLEVSSFVNSQIFDFNGKLLLSKELISGNQTIDVSNLNSGVYLLNVTNIEKKQSTTKFIKN